MVIMKSFAEGYITSFVPHSYYKKVYVYPKLI